ncbi:MAG: MFS transporter [Chloroflexi bacterium]|nr:MFS transporter [Chloroflexota bacterium]
MAEGEIAARPSPPLPGRIFYGWWLVLVLGITETITWGILYYGFTVLLPPMEADLGWSRGEMSGAFSLGVLLSGVCAAPVGRWLDRHGPRALMTAGAIAGPLLLVAWSRVESLPQLYAVWALIGVTMSTVLYEPAFAVIAAWFERRRARALTVITLMAGLASTIFMPLASWLVEMQGWRDALVTLAIVLAATTILPHALLLRRRPEDLGLHVDGDASVPHGSHASRRKTVSVGVALRESAFRWLAVAFSLTTLVSIGVSVHLVAYLVDHGYDPTLAATATGVVGGMQLLGRIVVGGLGDRIPLRVSGAVAFGIQPLSLMILLAMPGGLGLIGFVALFGAAKGAMTLLRPAFVADLYGRERYASIAGALAAVVTGATALAPVGAGAAHDLLGSYDPLFWGFVAISCIPAAGVLLVRR